MMPGLFDVRGKTVLVAGGTRGVGLLIARGFVEAGAAVMISSRKADFCASVATQLSTLGTCIPHPADLATNEGIRSLAGHAADFAPRLDVLINDVSATWTSIDRHASSFDHVRNINLQPALRLTHAVLPQLRAGATVGSPARVINVGSAHWPSTSGGDNFPYGGRRAALHILVRKLAPALAEQRITVNAIAAGQFPTKMADDRNDADHRESIEDAVPLGRLGDADDIAGAAIFLASRASAYLTGAVIPVDGGVAGAQ